MPSLICSSGELLVELLQQGAAAAILTEEALLDVPRERLDEWILSQPAWSDFPFIVLGTRQARRRTARALTSLQNLGNVILLERPVNAETLTSAANAAVRARSRQYLTRRQLEESRDTHDKLRMAQMAGGVGVFQLQIPSDVLTVSPEFCRVFGLPLTETMHVRAAEAVFDEDRKSVV